ncbi:MAG TPA: hypothetical protein VMX56_08830 [Anaerolineales bacterium]|nr:hypothetical protein [Anaerolineales bacterium]
MRKTKIFFFVLLAFASIIPAFAQDGDDRLDVDLRRNFGYRAGGRIQGRFTISADGPQDLERVIYLLDGEFFAESSVSPFQSTFSTSDYALGAHRVASVGTTTSGAEIFAEEMRLEFISAEQSWQQAANIAIPLVVGVVVLTGLGVLLPALMGRRSGSFKLGDYGPAGGAVCPRCRFPYRRHFLSPSLLAGKLERCPHCDKWAIIPRASHAALEKAEVRYRADAETGLLEKDPESSESQKKRKLDDTRYLDL